MALAEESGLISFPHFGAYLDRLFERFSRKADASESEQHRRDFVSAKLWDNPDAFSSEYDVQAMMSHFPGQF